MRTPAITLTEHLADWGGKLRFADLPADVVDGMMDRILDAVGVRMAGARTAFARKLGTALLLGAVTEKNCADAGAAFLNGALSSCLDFDDTHDRTLIHPTAPALFAAVSAACAARRPGRDLVAAVTAGVEIACRIACAAPSAFHARGFHPTGVVGVFGAAAAAAMILDPRPQTVRNALALAASFGAGITQPFIDGSDQRYLHSGNAAAAGLTAARLASAGIEGSREALEGRSGLFSSHTPQAAPFDFDAVTSGLGDRWECRSVLLKRYPAGFVTHPYIDAVLALTDIETIATITCVVPPAAVSLVCEPRLEKLTPASATMARVSLPHMLAEALIYRAVDAESFAAERLADPRVREWAGRIEYAVAGEGTAGPERLVVARRGRPAENIPVRMRPMSRPEIVGKFVANSALQQERAGDAAAALLRLHEVADGIAPILPLLAGGG